MFERGRRGIPAHDGGVDVKGERLARPFLNGNVVQLRAAFEMKIVHAAGKRAVAIRALEMIDDRDLAVFAADDQRVRKDGGVLALDPMEDFHRQGNLDIFRDVEKGAGREARLVQRGELVRAKLDRLGHEEPAKQFLILAGGGLKRLEQNALRESLGILMKQSSCFRKPAWRKTRRRPAKY